MGSISFQVIGDASVGTKSKTFQLSDANINRMIEWGKELHRLNGGAPPGTIPEALSAWGNHLMMDITKNGVMSFEHDQARFALPPPPPFVVTE